MARMSREELEAFLSRPHIAVLTTIRPDGSLHSTPVWYEYLEGRFYFWSDLDSVKVKDLAQNPFASVCVATRAEPYQYVSAEGPCEMTKDGLAERCLSICRRYYSEEAAKEFVDADLRQHDTTLLIMTPRRLMSEDSA
jgi:PPOX class probable F420-dependent enzyme